MGYYQWLLRELRSPTPTWWTLVGVWVVLTQGYYSWLMWKILRGARKPPGGIVRRGLMWVMLLVFHALCALAQIGELTHNNDPGKIVILGACWFLGYVVAWFLLTEPISEFDAKRLVLSLSLMIVLLFLIIALLTPAVH